ncbi:7655_t:CDS:2, partial [Gigaspora rosea]
VKLEQLKIGFYKINGIKRNRAKLQELINFGIEQNLDIVGLTETNTNVREATFFEINWRKEWQTHLTEVIVKNIYALKVVFRFKKTILVVWVEYFSPNDKSMQRKLQQYIMENVTKSKLNTRVIIGGDFSTKIGGK